MRFYNAKTGKYYDLPKLLIVGPIEKSKAVLKDFGVFEAMIYEHAAAPDSVRFVLAENRPPGWDGDTVKTEDFVQYTKSRELAKKVSGDNNATVNSQAVKKCRWAEFGGLVDETRPCMGRRVVCQHSENKGMIRREIECKPYDPGKSDLENLRACILFKQV